MDYIWIKLYVDLPEAVCVYEGGVLFGLAFVCLFVCSFFFK